MKECLSFCKKTIDYIVGWIETVRYQEVNYKYVIDTIHTNDKNKYRTWIRYKIMGCRTLVNESVENLNKSHLFSLFRPDHAQMIVSIATVESLIHKSSSEIIDRYVKYIDQCASKIQERKKL